MIEERDLDAPWEPRTFQVGDRVRVRLSGECQVLNTLLNEHKDYEPTFKQTGHFPQENGATGVIVRWPPHWEGYPVSNHHHLAVVFDRDVEVTLPDGDKGYLSARCYAALELELIEESQ